MSKIRAGHKYIGPGAPCFIAAEIGINHNGDMALAKRMIDAAADAGADAVKFQNYRTEDFLSDHSLTYTYVSQGRQVTESQFAMFKRCELTAAQLLDLCRHCEARDVVFFSTPTGEDGIADLIAAGAPVIKNGSDYLTHLPMIRAMARTGLPLILSTGMAVEEEIADAVTAFKEAGGQDLVILHCTSAYPTPAAEVNLRKIATLKARFGHLVGFSDHSWGTTAALGAVALGACFVEKHFTIDKNLPGPDHAFSSDAAEFAELVRAVRDVETMLGQKDIGPTPSEISGRNGYRLSCVAVRDLPAGYRLDISDIAFRRPGTGLAPKHATALAGRITAHAVSSGEPLLVSDFSPLST